MAIKNKHSECSQGNRSVGIDQFRLLAAVMVVAIHTFPFAGISETLNQVVTLTLFRVAVPFFFMVTGYYVLGPYSERRNYPKSWRIDQAILETAKMYLFVCLLYLPLSFYTGILSFSMTVSELLKTFIFDGPLYHLWYFPAVILGLILSRCLLKNLTMSFALAAASLLYLIGLAGDSYYALTIQLPVLKPFYLMLFHLFDYTRNGLFLAPLFLILGAQLYRKRSSRFSYPAVKLVVSLLFLAVEGFLLHSFTKVRHDSMYLALPIASYYLFIWVKSWQPKLVFPRAKEYSLGLYILHPLSLILLYYGAKPLPFLQNSLVQFFLTLIITIGLTAVALKCLSKFKHSKTVAIQRAKKQLDFSALHLNYQTIKQQLSERTELMAVVKAEAYGHGAVEVSRFLEKVGVDFFAVATLTEAIQLRKNGVQGELLILGYTSPEEAGKLTQYDLIQSVFSLEYATRLNRKKTVIRCHIKIDTGMHRLGFPPSIQELQTVYSMKYLQLEGIYSHLGSADSLEPVAKERTKQQISVFDHLLTELANLGIDYGITHLQSSYGIVHYPELSYDYARVGIFLYGVLSKSDRQLQEKLQLKPVLSIKAVLVSTRRVAAGQYIGYGTAVKATREMRVGTVAIGYADGIPRSISNTGYVLRYKDFELPQIGNVCMDMLLIDLTEVNALSLGEEVEVMENCESMAEKGETITNELLSRLGTRLEHECKSV